MSTFLLSYFSTFIQLNALYIENYFVLHIPCLKFGFLDYYLYLCSIKDKQFQLRDKPLLFTI